MARGKKAEEKAKETDAATIQISVDDFVRTRDAVSSLDAFVYPSFVPSQQSTPRM
jgi:hypothetical protein